MTDFQPDRACPRARAWRCCTGPLAAPAEAGVLNVANGRYVLNTLDAAIDGCLARQFAAMVTARRTRGDQTTRAWRFPAHPNTWLSAPTPRAW